MNGDLNNNNQGNQPSLYAISPESIQPQFISPGSIQPQPIAPPFPQFPGTPPFPQPYPPYPDYGVPQYPPYPTQPYPGYQVPQYPPYPSQPAPQYPPYQPYPPFPQPSPTFPPTTIGGCNQKWATVRTRDGRRLYIYVTSISEDSVGGFLPNGRQIALDYDEIVEMTC